MSAMINFILISNDFEIDVNNGNIPKELSKYGNMISTKNKIDVNVIDDSYSIIYSEREMITLSAINIYEILSKIMLGVIQNTGSDDIGYNIEYLTNSPKDPDCENQLNIIASSFNGDEGDIDYYDDEYEDGEDYDNYDRSSIEEALSKYSDYEYDGDDDLNELLESSLVVDYDDIDMFYNIGAFEASKDDIKHDKKQIMIFLEIFIPGDSGAIAKLRKNIAKRWINDYAMSKEMCKNAENRIMQLNENLGGKNNGK